MGKEIRLVGLYVKCYFVVTVHLIGSYRIRNTFLTFKQSMNLSGIVILNQFEGFCLVYSY